MPNRFQDYAVDQFNPEIVATKLVSQSVYRGRRWPILLAGFASWVIGNSNKMLIRDSMISQLFEDLSVAENKNKEQFASNPHGAPLRYSLMPLREPALMDLLQTFGGYSGLRNALAHSTIKQTRLGLVSDAKDVIDIAAVIHLYAVTGGKKTHQKKMSVEFAVGLVKQIQTRRYAANRTGRPAVSIDTLRDRWDNVRNSVALIYAASLMPIKGPPLLETILERPSDVRRSEIERWFLIANRVSKLITRHCAFHKDKTPTQISLPKVGAIKSVPESRIRLCERLWLTEQFQDLPTEWAKIQKRIEMRTALKCSIGSSACKACQNFKVKFSKYSEPEIVKRKKPSARVFSGG